MLQYTAAKDQPESASRNCLLDTASTFRNRAQFPEVCRSGQRCEYAEKSSQTTPPLVHPTPRTIHSLPGSNHRIDPRPASSLPQKACNTSTSFSIYPLGSETQYRPGVLVFPASRFEY